MSDLKLVIKNCLHCPWKTEYNGWPKDYWMCDQKPGRIIPSKYLKEETMGEPWFCPWKLKSKLTIKQWLRVYVLAVKYWCQGDNWEKAKGYALSLVGGWKR